MSDEIKQYEPTRGIEGSILCVLYIYIKKKKPYRILYKSGSHLMISSHYVLGLYCHHGEAENDDEI